MQNCFRSFILWCGRIICHSFFSEMISHKWLNVAIWSMVAYYWNNQFMFYVRMVHLNKFWNHVFIEIILFFHNVNIIDQLSYSGNQHWLLHEIELVDKSRFTNDENIKHSTGIDVTWRHIVMGGNFFWHVSSKSSFVSLQNIVEQKQFVLCDGIVYSSLSLTVSSITR